MSVIAEPAAIAAGSRSAQRRERWPPSYWPFVVPALIVVLAVIVFPWLFTIWMSLNEWKVGTPTTFVGLFNYLRLPNDPRFVESVLHTAVYTALSVLLPLVLGTFAAVVFHERFPLRGFLRGLVIMPMMATPVAIALVWTMMFHPQLGVLNYLLSLVGLPAQLVSDHRRRRLDRADHRHAQPLALHGLDQAAEVAVTGEQHDVIEVFGHLQDIDGQLDVHVALDLAST